MNHININPSDARDVLGYHNHVGDREYGDFKRNPHHRHHLRWLLTNCR